MCTHFTHLLLRISYRYIIITNFSLQYLYIFFEVDFSILLGICQLLIYWLYNFRHYLIGNPNSPVVMAIRMFIDRIGILIYFLSLYKM